MIYRSENTLRLLVLYGVYMVFGTDVGHDSRRPPQHLKVIVVALHDVARIHMDKGSENSGNLKTGAEDSLSLRKSMAACHSLDHKGTSVLVNVWLSL